MISLDQIRLLEGKITRALDLVRTLREENATLRQGLTSAQKRMKELETLVDGLKTDQKEIESIIVRTLHNLDDLEETAASRTPAAAATPPGGASAVRRGERAAVHSGPAETDAASTPAEGAAPDPESGAEARPAAEELDIF